MTASLPPISSIPPPLNSIHEGALKPQFTSFEKRHFHFNIAFGATFFLITLSVIVLISTCLCFTLPGINAISLLPGLIPSCAGLFVGLSLSLLVAWIAKRRNKSLSELLETQKNIIKDPSYDLINKNDEEIKDFIETHFLIQKNTTKKVNFSTLLHKKFNSPKGTSPSKEDKKIQTCLEALKKEIPKKAAKKEEEAALKRKKKD